MTTSFGSICFGSLLIAVIEMLKAMIESVRLDPDNGGCTAFLLCIVDCLLSCLEGILKYFNKFSYIYVGMVSVSTMWCYFDLLAICGLHVRLRLTQPFFAPQLVLIPPAKLFT
jgi:hypothetical protein